MPHLRSCRVLRHLEEQTCLQALSRDGSPGCSIHRTRRNLGLVLCRQVDARIRLSARLGTSPIEQASGTAGFGPEFGETNAHLPWLSVAHDGELHLGSGWCARNAFADELGSSIGWPFRAVITSPARIPALSAGPPGRTELTRTPRVPFSPAFEATSNVTGWTVSPSWPRWTLPYGQKIRSI